MLDELVRFLAVLHLVGFSLFFFLDMELSMDNLGVYVLLFLQLLQLVWFLHMLGLVWPWSAPATTSGGALRPGRSGVSAAAAVVEPAGTSMNLPLLPRPSANRLSVEYYAAAAADACRAYEYRRQRRLSPPN